MNDAALTPHDGTPAIGIVAGSGMQLRGLFDRIDQETSFDALAAIPNTTVAGHPGSFIAGQVFGQRVVLQQGRFHHYEGLDYEAVVFPVGLLHRWGCRELIFCNAAGGLLTTLRPGDFVAITQAMPWHAMGLPLPQQVDTNFQVPGCTQQGSYLWVGGPNYETRAEIRAMQRLGYAVVGMSTLPEMYYAQTLGIRSAAISCVSNSCVHSTPLSHAHVLEVAQATSTAMCQVLRKYLKNRCCA